MTYLVNRDVLGETLPPASLDHELTGQMLRRANLQRLKHDAAYRRKRKEIHDC